MTRPVRGLSVTLATLVILLGGVPRAAEASLIGDSVTCATTVTFANLECVPATATVGSGAEFTIRVPSFQDLFSVDVAASSITVEFPFPDANLTLDGVGLLIFGSLESSLGAIVGASLTTVAGVTGIDASDLSFTADSVTLDLNGPSNWDTQGSDVSAVVISLLFENAAAVPVPATLLLVFAGLVGVGAWRRRVAP